MIDAVNLQVAVEDDYIRPDIPSLPSNLFPNNARELNTGTIFYTIYTGLD